MLDNNDITLLERMMRGLMQEALQQNNVSLKREIREEVHSLISASEHRLIKRMDTVRFEIVSDLAQ